MEAAALAREDASLVIADAPPLGIAAGKAAGRPTVLLGNFTWDWIYAAYPGGAAVAEAIGRIYASADLAVRLPLHGGFAHLPAHPRCAVHRATVTARPGRRSGRHSVSLPIGRWRSCRSAATASISSTWPRSPAHPVTAS